MPKTLYLIDGHAQIYRAYYAPFGSLNSPTGEPTRATHVFCQMLLNLLRDRRPDYLALTMDVSDETVFRRDIDPDYKAHREPPPEDLPIQTERIVQIINAMRIPLLRVPRFEADDIMATLVHRYAGEGLSVYLVSKDKDLEQLLSPHVALFDPGKNEVITPVELAETKGWTPELAVEAQILTGDPVDNVSGVKGIGPKTAAKLLEKYGSVKEIIAHADELTPKQRENVLAFEPRVDITRQLVTLRDDVPIEFDLADAERGRFDYAAAHEIFAELGFRRLLEQWATAFHVKQPEQNETNTTESEQSAPQPPVSSQKNGVSPKTPDGGEYELVNTEERLTWLAEQLAQQPEFAVDTETTGVNPINADLVGLSFAWKAGHGFYVPVRSALGQIVPLEVVKKRLGPVLADEAIGKVGQNLKYDLIVLHQAGLPVAGKLFDTMIAAFVLHPLRTTYKLDRLVTEFLDHEMIPISDLIGKGRDQLRMDQVPLDSVAEYAAEDADYTRRLKELFEPELHAQGFERLFYDTEMPLVAVLTEMERNGIRVDLDVLAEMSAQMAARANEIVDEVHKYAGGPFNLDSPKQLGEVLFDKLDMRVVKKTKTSRSTDAATLETLARETQHPMLTLLLEYREIQKLRGTYVDALPKDVSPRTGRIHTSYHQTGAVTGRLSSSEPNLQNIPIRTEQGRQIRRAFVPGSADELLIVADYSQVELRVLADFCKDEALIDAFANDLDIHAVVAAQINGVPLEEVTREMRARAKAVNFGIIYGQTAHGLAQSTGLSRTEAQEFIDAYFARYPRIRSFIDDCIQTARNQGHVETLLGRRRPIPEIHSQNNNTRALGERLAVNTVIQGSAADIIKIAMARLHRRIHAEGLPLRMLLQVHDELVCEAPRSSVDEMIAVVREAMTGGLPLSVPLKVDIAAGGNWLEAK